MEFGGTDQKFNILLGRELQRAAGQKAGPAGEGQAVLLVPLLVGLDGTQKMSQSLGNFIAIDDPPHEMFGKIMSIPDTLIMDYLGLLTDVPDGELAALREDVAQGGAKAMDAKARLAREVVSQFHGGDAAEEANAAFERTFRKREAPEEQVPVVEVPFRKVADLLKGGQWARPTGDFEDQPLSDADARVRYDGVDRLLLVRAVEAPPKRAIGEVDRHRQRIEAGQGIVLSLSDIIEPTFGLSRLEANRMIVQGGVDVDG